eukprot:CAMPEP_0202876622 /NCGR_PEP_ID=MMETSP1391-20130828/29319_1 /ASSEMBLY_ACC=CAM_ASM_000867 /TAXON_ID=1034604 /ORGANISM="Chlamydomonas leiostraca, Strain SAG 11-49" /LENGTH=60 /DNA_ID=CAMNT_0049558515 /DNA_START=39 /DNA_END=218 /DNA_ORIENTATION=+
MHLHRRAWCTSGQPPQPSTPNTALQSASPVGTISFLLLALTPASASSARFTGPSPLSAPA